MKEQHTNPVRGHKSTGNSGTTLTVLTSKGSILSATVQTALVRNSGIRSRNREQLANDCIIEYNRGVKNYYDFDYKRVGWVKQKTYRQVSSAEKEMKKEGWGILRYIVGDFKKHGVEKVRILDTDTNTIYITNAELYLDAMNESLDKEQKVYLPLEEFKTINYVKKQPY